MFCYNLERLIKVKTFFDFMKLHIGCGRDKRKGYVNCDISPEVNPDKIVDIEKKLPFKNSSVEEIIMNHVLEHTFKPIEVMKEIYRICKDGAIVKIRVPYFSSESAFSQIDHYAFFSWTTFDCLDGDSNLHWQGAGNFKTVYKRLKWRGMFKLWELFWSSSWRMTRIYQEFFCWFIPAREMEIHLRVRK